MLHINESMKTLKGELYSFRNVCTGIADVLRKVDSTTNLTKELGVFAVQMPTYKILSKDADSATKIIRKVCTGELNADDALVKIEVALREVEMLQKMVSPFIS